jgi:hypothetical protein
MVGDMAIAIEVFQIAFIVLLGLLVAMKSSKKHIENYPKNK